ncbi:SMI1/KNR4 family protein [Pseudomonas sp. RP23018S]|uniref:SMI1/KNR4 family protein n=1 Tax=Pseudomonas sp. RP23018S TaxID=3096037 RepID=UPI002ACAA533|nr:SMI1/KNR4 family protein [Pseudomonas sp. RP23018S]MDZ5601839.1 SMI1/KNR4 family protein [Pseudomonas sp. RP23018S]
MNTSIERLQHWLEAHLPDLREDLSPGCSEAALDAFEALIGRPLPECLKALYRTHDGQGCEVNTGPFFGLTFLSLAQARAHWQSWNDIIDAWTPEDRDEASAFSRSATPGAIKPLYANRYWIPFAYDYGGNYLGVDLDPDTQGTVGQVINFGRDEDEKYVLADSFGAFLTWLVEQLEGGQFVLREEDDGGMSLNTRTPATFHFLDAVASLFAVAPGKPA